MKTLKKSLDRSHYLQSVKNVWGKGKKRRSASKDTSFLKLMFDPIVMFTLCSGFFLLGGVPGIGVYLLLLGCMFFVDLASDENKL
jgi:hypothetical protein